MELRLVTAAKQIQLAGQLKEPMARKPSISQDDHS